MERCVFSRGRQWAVCNHHSLIEPALLQTGGIKVMVYAIEDNSILLTNDDGKIHEVRRFVLEQPEVEKFTWNSQDYFPTPDASKGKKKRRRGGKSKNGKKGKGKKGKGNNGAATKRQEKGATEL